jgi:hypothetical protein
VGQDLYRLVIHATSLHNQCGTKPSNSAVALVVRDDLDTVVDPRPYAAVGRAQVDADSLFDLGRHFLRIRTQQQKRKAFFLRACEITV